MTKQIRRLAAVLSLSMLLAGCDMNRPEQAAETPETTASGTETTTETTAAATESAAESVTAATTRTTASSAKQSTTTGTTETAKEPALNALGRLSEKIQQKIEENQTESSDEERTPPMQTVIEQTTEPVQTEPPDYTKYFTLTVDETGLVVRSEDTHDVMNLGWVICFNGEEMLERSATGEISYRPMNYGSGEYSVYLRALLSGGYTQVSNTVTFSSPYERAAEDPSEQLEGFETPAVLDCKEHMKHLIAKIGSMQYRLGFVMDADHDGICDGIAFYSGGGKQYVFDSRDARIKFDTQNTAERFGECELGIWFDTETGMDYIAAVTADGHAYDCVTGEEIEAFEKDDFYFTFGKDGESDTDHFYVSYRGKPVLEHA
ncbi:MAG: hypothetical protein J6Z40_01055 [Oscillospiraceae bacterium]|nr:hypothetical protein [Oscillospiraceae bacterium]